MPIKTLTPWDIAKPLLEEDYLKGEVTNEMTRMQVWLKRKEYQACKITNFGNNWNAMKKRVKAFKDRAKDDEKALAHDRALYPKKKH